MTEAQDHNFELEKEALDLAVRTALETNSKSAIMFLLRERMIREIIECVTPIIVKPYIDRIRELESTAGSTSTISAPPPAKATDARLLKLRETLEDMAELTDQE